MNKNHHNKTTLHHLEGEGDEDEEEGNDKILKHQDMIEMLTES